MNPQQVLPGAAPPSSQSQYQYGATPYPPTGAAGIYPAQYPAPGQYEQPVQYQQQPAPGFENSNLNGPQAVPYTPPPGVPPYTPPPPGYPGYQPPSYPQSANLAPQPAPSAGYACMKCGTIYNLPAGSTTWRCQNCGKLNALNPENCCTIL